MADPIAPQAAAGSSSRRSEPQAPGHAQPHAGQATDGVPEAIDGAAPANQSRRYAHTMRRELSAPVRVAESLAVPESLAGSLAEALAEALGEATADSLDGLDGLDEFDIATIAKPKPARLPEPVPPPPPPALPGEISNRTSAPSESTALYRKRTNPTLPAVSPDIIARAASAAPAAADDAPLAAALSAATRDRDDDDDGNDDAASRLPAVMLDPVGPGHAASSLALRRPPTHLIVGIAIAAAVVIAAWLLRSII